MNPHILSKLKKDHNISYLEDVLLKKDFFSFYINLNDKEKSFFMISGSPSIVGLEDKPVYTVLEIVNHIEPDNTFSEIDGKNLYIQKLTYQIEHLSHELYTFIPFKNKTHDKPIWLYLKFDKDKKNNLVFGQVLRIYDETPSEIVYYQKTHQDPLTKLFTRETLKDHLSKNTHQKNAYGMYLDIDGFKQINDFYGHEKGDQFLITLANFFISRWEHNVIYYRLGGDEFFIYAFEHTKEQIIKRAKQLIYDIEHLNLIAQKHNISVSIGIIELCADLSEYNKILDLGDKTMYHAKKQGPGRFAFYNQSNE